MATESDFKKAIELLERSSNVLITCHTRPDGDACGCVRAMQLTIEQLGKTAEPMFLSSVPAWYKFLFDSEPAVLNEDIAIADLDGRSYDLVVVVDTNSYVQLPEFDEWLKQSHLPVLVIDHHVTGDGLGSIEVIDTTAGAAGLIVYDLFKYAGWQVTADIADNLFTAISTDTGWFKFRNADSRAHRTAADLIDAGARPTFIHEEIYQNYSQARMDLLVRMLNSLTLELGGQVAFQHITQEDFAQTGAAMSDTEDLIDQCQKIASVTVAVLFTELQDGRFKLSLRSKDSVDVRAIAQKYDGGGHTMAAGCRMEESLDTAKQMILDDIKEQLIA